MRRSACFNEVDKARAKWRPQNSSPPFNPSSLEALLSRLQAESDRRLSRTKLLRYRPYPKQAAFHAAGARHRERLLMAGNQLGKTYSGAAEAAIHLTGKYPDWWQGRRWDRPVRAWAGSETGEVTRDGVQRLLIGEPKDETQWGTGLIPGDDLVDWKRKQGVPDALDGALIKHVSGGNSMLAFKTSPIEPRHWADIRWLGDRLPRSMTKLFSTRTSLLSCDRVHVGRWLSANQGLGTGIGTERRGSMRDRGVHSVRGQCKSAGNSYMRG